MFGYPLHHYGPDLSPTLTLTSGATGAAGGGDAAGRLHHGLGAAVPQAAGERARVPGGVALPGQLSNAGPLRPRVARLRRRALRLRQPRLQRHHIPGVRRPVREVSS